jgi:hypothetical protein
MRLPARSITARLRRADGGDSLSNERRCSSAVLGRSASAWVWIGKGQGARPASGLDYPVIRFQPARVAALTSSKFLATTSQLTILAPPVPAALSAT